jgi:hypothetical protein
MLALSLALLVLITVGGASADCYSFDTCTTCATPNNRACGWCESDNFGTARCLPVWYITGAVLLYDQEK